MNNLSLVQSFPTLYAIDKNGKIKVWTAAVLQPVATVAAADAGYATSRITHGYINGKQQVALRDYTAGKNIGRSNETTPLAQCISETQRKWTDKKEKEAYSETKPADYGEGYGDISGGWYADDGGDDDAVADAGPFLPMLAQTFNPADAIITGAGGAAGSKKKKVITFPCFVQPKLDGLRCVSYATHPAHGSNDAGPTVALQSRTGAFFTGLPHIAAALRPYLSQHPSIVIDGELYTDQMPFEELAGLIKKKKITDSDAERLKKVKYHVYDIYDRMNENMPYSERLGVLAAAVRRCGCVANDTFHSGGMPVAAAAAANRVLRSAATTVVATDEAATVVVLVRTEKVAVLSDFRRLFAEFVEAGYEGIMLRNAAGVYRANYRSNDLQKYKEFMEDEYRIIDFKEGEGRDAGAVIWVCETADGKEFTVRPRGTMEQRREWFNDGESYIGKNLTVVYQELTEEGKPRFPVAKCVREGF
jgi:DNA ligase-1